MVHTSAVVYILTQKYSLPQYRSATKLKSTYILPVAHTNRRLGSNRHFPNSIYRIHMEKNSKMWGHKHYHRKQWFVQLLFWLQLSGNRHTLALPAYIVKWRNWCRAGASVILTNSASEADIYIIKQRFDVMQHTFPCVRTKCKFISPSLSFYRSG